MRRFVSIFEKAPSHAFVGELDFETPPDVEHLRRLFRQPANEPMFDCFPITKAQAPELERHEPGAR